MRRRIPLLRGWSILAVVCHHATGWGFIAMFWWVHRYRPATPPNYDQLGTPPYYVLTTLNQLALFSVPAFLFISGLFVAYTARGAATILSWKVVKARLLNLLWPYLIWSIVIFIGDGLLGTVYSPIEYLTKLITGGAVEAYFFIPLLAQFYLLSPFLVRWAKIRPRFLLALSALLQLVLVSIPYLGGIWGSSVALQKALKALDWVCIRWAFFFILGVIGGFQLEQIGSWLVRYKWELLAAAALLGALSILESQLIYHATSDWNWAHAPLKLSSTFYAVAFILAFLAWDSWPPALSRVVGRIGGMSYGIYLIHYKSLELIARLIYHVAPGVLAQQLVLAFLLFVLVLGGTWLLMDIVAKSPARRVYRYLFG
jgi:peptidoglycan/LPS O-acetylase OafA/YrhL